MKKRLREFYFYLNSGFKQAQQREVTVIIPHGSRTQVALLEILQKEGFIHSWQAVEEEKHRGRKRCLAGNFPPLRVNFRKIPRGRHFHVSPLSETHVDLYFSLPELRAWTDLRGMDLMILSTHRGLLTHRQCLQYSLGGLLLCRLQVN